MAFGEDYRKEINDVNAGRIEIKSSTPRVTSNRTPETGRETRVDTRSQLGALRDFVGLADKTISAIGDREKERNYNKAYSASAEEAQKAIDEHDSGILDFIFGKTATMKGFAQRIIDDEQNQNYLSNLTNMDESVTKYKNHEEYKTKVLDKQLSQALEKHSDPDVRAGITKTFMQNAKSLANNFVQKKAVYVQALNRRAVQDKIISASDIAQNASDSGDANLQSQAKEVLQDAFTKPEEMSDIAYQDVLTNAIVDRLGNHEQMLYEEAKAQGLLDNLDALNKDKLETAYQNFLGNNSMLFAKMKNKWEREVATGTGNPESTMQQMFNMAPEQVNIQAMRKAAFDAEEARTVEEARKQSNALCFARNGAGCLYNVDSKGQGSVTMGAADTQEAFNRNISTIAQQGVMLDRRNQVRTAQLAGQRVNFDPNGSITEADKTNWINNHPEQVADFWTGKQEIMPALQSQVKNIVELLRNPTLTQPQLDEIKRQTDNVNVLRYTDQDLFAKHFAKDQQSLDRFLQFDTFVNQGNMTPAQAVERMRLLEDAPVPDMALADPDVLESIRESAVEQFQKSAGDKWDFGLFQIENDPENEDEMNAIMDTYVRDAYIAAKGTASAPETVARLAYMRMLKDGEVMGNRFVPYGRRADTEYATADNYILGLDQSEQFKNSQRWLSAGFAPDESIFDDDKKIRVDRYGNVTVHGRHKDYGFDIFVTIPKPQSMKDVRPATRRRWYNPLSYLDPKGDFVGSPDQGPPERLVKSPEQAAQDYLNLNLRD